MCLPNIVEIAKADLYTNKEELAEKYAQSQVEHLLRLRDMVTWSIANPDAKDRQFVDEERTRYGLSLVTAYADLKIVKAILPNMGEASRDFHRWRYNEMILETYQIAKKRKDTKTMEKAATSYAKFNRIDIEDEQSVPYHMIVVQPSFPTTDFAKTSPRRRIPNQRRTCWSIAPMALMLLIRCILGVRSLRSMIFMEDLWAE